MLTGYVPPSNDQVVGVHVTLDAPYDGVTLFFFFITLKPGVECYTKSMRLKYEPAWEPLHISVK